ncbi:hypothetical protein HanRHA438_Chr16g0773891 [Helianthus annuus]|nr:hypothetical protein HanRHA438_Chr16g0773891 [Helianthus annuus]
MGGCPNFFFFFLTFKLNFHFQHIQRTWQGIVSLCHWFNVRSVLPIGPTSLLFYRHFKITFFPRNSVPYHWFKWAASNTHLTNQFIIFYRL